MKINYLFKYLHVSVSTITKTVCRIKMNECTNKTENTLVVALILWPPMVAIKWHITPGVVTTTELSEVK